MAMAEVLHFLKRWPGNGGMAAMAILHQTLSSGKDEVIGLSGSSAWKPIGLIRNKLRSLLEQGPQTHLYYNGYGIDWGISRNIDTTIACLHSDFPCLENLIKKAVEPHANGFISVNRSIQEKISHAVSGLRMESNHVVPLSVGNSYRSQLVPEWQERELVIGYSGRIQFEQKRLDRLPEFINLLEASGLNWKIELLGEGPDLGLLREFFKSEPRIHFHGFMKPDQCAGIMGNWRYQLFLSDYEGLPISLLEGMLRGALPVFPVEPGEGNSVLDLCAEGAYQKGNSADAVARIVEFESMNPLRVQNILVQRLSGMQGNFSELEYLSAMDSAIRAIKKVNRGLSPTRIPGWMPVWVYNRVFRKRTVGQFSRQAYRLN
jgi:glycosyltransferase involved in cell wall biosynthesis